MLHTFLVYKFLVKHRSCGTLLEFLLARLDPPSNRCMAPATNAGGGPRRQVDHDVDTCARVLSQQPGVLQQAFLPTVLPPSPSAARGAARLADIEASGPLRTFS